MNATTIKPRSINPLHETRDAAKLAAITADMLANGWRGMPLLVVGGEDDQEVQAWTGSHRWQAAMDAGLEEIPVVRIDTDSLAAAAERAGYDADAYVLGLSGLAGDDRDRLAIVEELGNADAIAIMQAEDEANQPADEAGAPDETPQGVRDAR